MKKILLILALVGCSTKSGLSDCDWTLCSSTGQCDGCDTQCGGTPGCPGDGQGSEYSPYYHAPWYSYYPCTMVMVPDRPSYCDNSIHGATYCAIMTACCTNTIVMAPFGPEMCPISDLYQHCEEAAACGGCAFGDVIDPDTGNCAP